MITHLGTWQCGRFSPNPTPAAALLHARAEQMALAAAPWLPPAVALELARNVVADLDESPETVRSDAERAIRNRARHFGLAIAEDQIGPCADAMAATWKE